MIGQVNSGQCFKYKGSKSSCTLDGRQYEFFEVEYESGSGWIAGTLLKTGSSSECETPSEDCPRIVSRADWGARKPRKVERLKLPVPKVFIHHTVTASCHDQKACEKQVKTIQNGHMDGKETKWPDIGYNFLVGEDGNAYEGRGWDTVGSQAKHYNNVSIGISVIGNFTKSAPNTAALNVVKELIACGVSKGKVSKSYQLHGHRDGKCTECPGDKLYKIIKEWPNYNGDIRKFCP